MKTKFTKIILALFLIANSAFSTPTYVLRAKNFTYTAIDILEFDIFLKRTGTEALEYESGQYIFNFNTAFANGGTLTYTIVSGSSQLPSNLKPTIAGVFGDELRIAPNIPGCGGSGFFISTTGDGTKISRMRLQTNAACGFLGNLNLTWKNSLGYFTQLYSFDKLNITNPTGHFVDPDLTSSSTNVTVIAGANTTNFFNLYQAFNAIDNGGIYLNQNITVNINANTFETSTPTLKGSIFNTCIIKPTASVIVSASTCVSNIEALIFLDGADNVTVDGRIGGTGTTRSLTLNSGLLVNYGIKFMNGATQNIAQYIISNNFLNSHIYIAESYVGGNNDNLIENCLITNGSIGIYNKGDTYYSNDDNVVRKNTINNCPGYGIWIDRYTRNSTIEGNEIFHTILATTNNPFTAIKFNGVGINFITKNKIYNLNYTSTNSNNRVGIDITPLTVVTGSNTTIVNVYNNFISLGGSISNSQSIKGINSVLQSIPITVNLYYNSVYLYGPGSGAGSGNSSYGIYTQYLSGSPSFFNQKNNISINERNGSSHQANYILNTSGITLDVDYNCYWATGSSIARWINTQTNNLCTYQTAAGANEQNTKFKNVTFAGATVGDLHLIAPSIGDFDLVAKPIVGITDDIDNPTTTRHAQYPYKGADESTTLLSIQPGIVIVRVNSSDRIFPNLKLAFDEINANGCQRYSGQNVEVIITANTSENAKAELDVISPPFTSCLVRPNVNAVTVTGAASLTPLIELKGVENVTFDGDISGTKSLTVTGDGDCIKMTNGASNNIVRNVNCNGLSGKTINVDQSSATGNTTNTVEFCNINKGTIGINTEGSQLINSLIAKNNTIKNCTSTGVSLGNGSSGSNVQLNEFKNDVTTSLAADYSAIECKAEGTNDIQQNKIYDDLINPGNTNYYGIKLSAGAVVSTINVTNNFIRLSQNNLKHIKGIYTIGNILLTAKINHNTILLTGIDQAGSATYGIFADVETVAGYNQKNNICINKRTGGNLNSALNILSTTGDNLDVDYNCYWADQTTGKSGGWNSSYIAKYIPGYQCLAFPNEKNTIFKDVSFVSAAAGDLHLANSGDYELIGISMPFVTTDIDAVPNSRNPIIPYMGADEASPFAINGKIKIRAYIDNYPYPQTGSFTVEVWECNAAGRTLGLLFNQLVNYSSNGIVTINCPAALSIPSTNTFYIVIKNPDQIETWSEDGGEKLSTVPGQFLEYNFTTGADKAFAYNMKTCCNKAFIFFGDTNDDGYIESTIDVWDTYLNKGTTIAKYDMDFNLPTPINQTDVKIAGETNAWMPYIEVPSQNGWYINRPGKASDTDPVGYSGPFEYTCDCNPVRN